MIFLISLSNFVFFFFSPPHGCQLQRVWILPAGLLCTPSPQHTVPSTGGGASCLLNEWAHTLMNDGERGSKGRRRNRSVKPALPTSWLWFWPLGTSKLVDGDTDRQLSYVDRIEPGSHGHQGGAQTVCVRSEAIPNVRWVHRHCGKIF